MYKQSVTSEDIFLGMSEKNPSSQSCNQMVVRVQLPQTTLKDITLDVTTSRLLLRSSKYFLSTYLPQLVDPVAVQAKWDSKKDTLLVTLNITREDE